MSVKKVRIIGDPILRQRAEEVRGITPEIEELIEDLIDTMYAKNGLGLAANQIGVLKRVVVLNKKGLEIGKGELVLINPQVIYTEGSDIEEEGCLSIPGLYAELERPYLVKVETLLYENGNLKKKTITGKGLVARALLHEIDHINGILFVDRFDEITRRILLYKWKLKHPEYAENLSL